jgi:hypothetical protein
MPPAASCTPKTALRTAYAVATPFHIESCPARVLRIGTFAVAVIAIACRAAARSRPIRLARPAAVPTPMPYPWSHPRSRSFALSCRRMKIS